MPARFTTEEFDEYVASYSGWIILSTITPEGFPHSVPLGFFYDGNSFVMGVRDNTTKIRNIEANPKVSLLLESGSTMADIKGVMVQGHATVHRDPDRVLGHMQAGARRRGAAEADLPTEARPGAAYIVVRPEKVISWDYGR